MFASMAAAFEFGPDDIVLPGSSISHIGGFLFSLAALAAGARVVVARSVEDTDMLSLLREEKPTVLFMLPATLFALVRGKTAQAGRFRLAARSVHPAATRFRPSCSASSPISPACRSTRSMA